jgi:cytochrome P450
MTVNDVDFFDAQTRDCPYAAYQRLRDDAPVWRDPRTGMYVLTRYEDIRAALLDPERFTNRVGNTAGRTEKALRPEDTEVVRHELDLEEELHQQYERDGWVTVPTLSGRDDPDHRNYRHLFDYAFRASRIRQLDPFVEGLANRLVEGFIGSGRCDVVCEFAVPLPLYVIGRQLGFPEEDMPQIKVWTDAWIKRMGLMQTPDERRRSAEQEIEAQHYFIKKVEQLRHSPEDTLLSDLVNNDIPGVGRPLNDNELVSYIMGDLLVGGSETSANGLSAGVMLLIQRPDLWGKLKSDLDANLKPFVEELLRIESPVQALLRETSTDVELHGVTIPAGSVVALRFGSANRDERRFQEPEEFDMDRPDPTAHLAFGLGTHHCLGAPLARRELYFGFKVLAERIEKMWFVEGENDFSYAPNYFVRALKQLNIGFVAA